MGTTSTYDLPYPEGTDLVVAGDDAIEALAKATATQLGNVQSAASSGLAAFEARTAPLSQAAQINRAPSGQALSGSGIVVAFPGTQAVMSGFYYDDAAGVLNATGPVRLFIVVAEVQTSLTSAGTNSFASTVELVQDDVVFAGSFDHIVSSTADLTEREFVHRITSPTQMGTGTTLKVNAYGTPGGTVGQVSLRVYPIGPAQ